MVTQNAKIFNSVNVSQQFALSLCISTPIIDFSVKYLFHLLKERSITGDTFVYVLICETLLRLNRYYEKSRQVHGLGESIFTTFVFLFERERFVQDEQKTFILKALLSLREDKFFYRSIALSGISQIICFYMILPRLFGD